MSSQFFPRLPLNSWLNLVLGLLLMGRGIQRLGQRGPTLWTVLVLLAAGWMLYRFYTAWQAARQEAALEGKGGRYNNPGSGFANRAGISSNASSGPGSNSTSLSKPQSKPGTRATGGAAAADGDNDGNDDSNSDDSQEETPIRSLVFFLDEPRRIEGGEWIGHLGQALGLDLSPDRKDATEFVMPMPHPVLTPQGDDCFMLKIPEGVFWIFHVKSPYIEDLAAWASRIPDQRLREAVEGHQAWISVDLLTWLDGPEDPARIYAAIGRILAALAGPDVRAVFAPEIGRANEFDPMILPRLSGGDPLALFEDPTFAPVLRAGNDDEQMEAAVDEARRRWPEFVRLFSRRDPASDRPYLVKAPFGSPGNTEHMWLVVNAVEGGTIHGTLANQPHHLLDHHEGQQVSVEAAGLTDWICADDNDEPLGGWTQKVLSNRHRRRSAD